ncbi:MAG: hypothetical protein PSX71_14850 [bacterium]|nr:hypothetical protein [bacterium]
MALFSSCLPRAKAGGMASIVGKEHQAAKVADQQPHAIGQHNSPLII